MAPPPRRRAAPAEPPPVPIPAARTPRVPRPALDLEQWLGQRALLAVGVGALVLAAGYLLKLSFDRGWISPFVRCVGGALAGFATGAIGWRLESRGLRTYGAAVMGSGAAIIYLSVWAATKLYAFLSPPAGIALLALVSLSLGAIAFAFEVEALGAAAAVGALLAPPVLGWEPGNADVLLAYLAAMGAAMGWVAARRRWRLTAALVALSYFGIGVSAAQRAGPAGVLAYGLAGGGAGLWVGLREGWWETRFLAFVGGWSLLHIAEDRIASPWPVVLGALALAAPVWRHALRARSFALFRPAAPGEARPSPGELIYFLATPVLLAGAVYRVAPDAFDADRGLLALLVAVPYLAVGLSRPRPEFAAVGAAAVALAALLQWEGVEAVWALLGLSLAWAALDHRLGRADGRWYSLASFGLAAYHLVQRDLPSRPDSDPAFVDAFALAVWATAGVAAALAAGLWRREPAPGATDRPVEVPVVLWTVAAVTVLLGVTGELLRLVQQSDLPAATKALAGGLSVSAWWLAYAGIIVGLGFRRDLKTVRQAGILVACFAALKVLLVDLSELDALYRVASVFILALVSLLVAYLYHRRARAAAGG